MTGVRPEMDVFPDSIDTSRLHYSPIARVEDPILSG